MKNIREYKHDNNTRYTCSIVEEGVNYVARIVIPSLENREIDVSFSSLAHIKTTKEILISLGWEYSVHSKTCTYKNLSICFMKYEMKAIFNGLTSDKAVFVGNLESLIDLMKLEEIDYRVIENIINRRGGFDS